jgi:GNAT superfamily N-acetyltransferase
VSVIIREAISPDRAAILQLVPRLRAFGTPPFHAVADLDAGESRTIDRYFDARPDGTQLWVAESSARAIAGAAYAQRMIDYFTQEPHAHLGILVVAENAEGLGVAKALMRQVEDWSRNNGLKMLTLNVFATNQRARRFYEHIGFESDIVRYAKSIDEVIPSTREPREIAGE